MEDSFIGGAIAEYTYTDLFAFLHFERQPHPDRLRNSTTHNSVRAEIVGLKISDMHRTTTTMVVAGVLTKEFSHHQIDVSALGNEMSMPAMMIDQIVIRTDRHADAGRHGFLPG